MLRVLVLPSGTRVDEAEVGTAEIRRLLAESDCDWIDASVVGEARKTLVAGVERRRRLTAQDEAWERMRRERGLSP
jgi:hypothetical protein